MFNVKKDKIINHNFENTTIFLGWGLIFITVIIIVCGTILSKYVALRYEGASVQRFTDPIFIGGYILLLVRGFTWMIALKHIPLSKAYPFLSLTFPLILLISIMVFREQFTWYKGAGTILIITGIIINGKKN